MKKILIAHIISFAFMTSILGIFSGCAATQVALSKKSLDVQTKMSNTIFLTPLPENEKTVYLQIKNTSDKPDLTIIPEVTNSLNIKGYKVVKDIKQANYILQVNILQAGKSDPTAAEKSLNGGFGSIITGGAIGLAGGALTQGSHRGTNMIVGGLIGAAVATAADTLVKDVTYTIITDVQISERSKWFVRENRRSSLNQGLSSNITQSSSKNVDWEKYQTRVVSTAEKVNLKFEDALPSLKAGLVSAISGNF